MCAKAMHLTDFFPAESIQELQDAFAYATKASVVIVDSFGNEITTPSNWGGFCGRFHPSPACTQSIRDMLAQIQESGAPASAACPNTGLTTAAVPIFLAGQYLGSWIFGQLRACEPPPEAMQRVAEALQLPAEDVRSLLQSLPDLSQTGIVPLFQFAETLNRLVLQLGHSKQQVQFREAELRGVARQLGANQRLLRKFIDSGDAAMYICDYESGEILMINESFCTQAGLSKAMILGRKCWEVNGNPGDTFCKSCPKSILLDAHGRPGPPHSRTVYSQKFKKWLRCTNQVIRWEGGRLAQMVTQCDITEERRMREDLERLAFYDSYTGLPNSIKFTQDLAQQQGLPGEEFMICFHLSSMRHFNEVYGREKGQELMAGIARWCGDHRNFGGTLYKLEGYAFCLLRKDVSRETAIAIAKEIERRFCEAWPIHFNGQDIPYYCTATLSLICLAESMKQEDVLNLVDRTLYVSHKSASLFIYDDKVDREAKDHLQFEMTLANCVKNDMQGFDVHFQPLVDVRTGIWKGLEALCRWTSPQSGSVSPGIFIPEAEQLGLISTIGEWVLETSISVCKRLQLDLLPEFFLSVNMSSIQIMDEDFAERVAQILQRHDYPGNKLNLEITESTEISFSHFTLSVIDRLCQLGIHMALDDFGTGYSSFNSLKSLPVDFLKTERAFIENIEKDDYLQYYFYIMSEIAHANNMKLIAEGIETREQYDIIKSNGADYIQGYYFSRPLHAAALEAQLSHFHDAEARLLAETPPRINIGQWLDGKNAYSVTPNIFKLLNSCMYTLLNGSGIDNTFQQALEAVGIHFNVCRAYAMLLSRNMRCSSVHEWCAPGIPAQMEHMRCLDPAVSLILLDLFRQDGMVVSSDIRQLPQALYEVLAIQGALSVVLLPIWNEDILEGVIGFDDSRHREWQPEEVIMLWNLSILMCGNIRNEQLQSTVTEKQHILADVLNSAGMNIFVSDLDTHEIIWINDVLRARYPIGPAMVGQKCYEIIQGRTEPCPFCKVGELLENPELGQVSYEHHNERWKRDFVVYSRLIQWETGRQVHIEYSLDVTEYKQTQQELEFLATTDALTGAINRRALMDRLQAELAQAHAEKKPATLAFVDVDMLKQINDTYGHHVGDQALQETAQALRRSIRSEDVLGRIGGDEFAILFVGCEEEIAYKRLLRATSQLDLHRYGAPLSFSFGFASNTELPYESGDAYPESLLQLADSRMLLRKQRKNARIVSAHPGAIPDSGIHSAVYGYSLE